MRANYIMHTVCFQMLFSGSYGTKQHTGRCVSSHVLIRPAVMGSGDGARFPVCCRIMASVWAAARTFVCGGTVNDELWPSWEDVLRDDVAPGGR